MRAFVLPVSLGLCLACGQKLDHPELAPGCDPAVMRCTVSMTPATGSPGGNGEGGAGSGDEVAAFTGDILAFNDDYFDLGSTFTGMAQVSATGQSGARVSASYDGKSFQLDSVLKDAANWFFTVPDGGSGMIPTLMPLDTRAATAAMLSLRVANGSVVDGIFLASSGTERALDRAQIVLHIVDEKRRSVTGVTGKLTAEVTSYRAAGSWVGVSNQNATDDSGMLFFGNVPAGTALSPVSVNLTGAVTASVEVTIVSGAISVVTAVVSP
ncbi:MAG: hypothetical protein ABUL60_18375 [Myxococcales bacterium]